MGLAQFEVFGPRRWARSISLVDTKEIDRAHRLGPKTSNCPRPMITKFKSYGINLQEKENFKISISNFSLQKLAILSTQSSPSVSSRPTNRKLYLREYCSFSLVCNETFTRSVSSICIRFSRGLVGCWRLLQEFSWIRSTWRSYSVRFAWFLSLPHKVRRFESIVLFLARWYIYKYIINYANKSNKSNHILKGLYFQ